MSILKKPYEISVWDDVWEDGQFIETKLGIIGSDKMIAQCRAIEPNLVRNTNGSKKLTFKMYYKYIDNITGEETINPFSKWLISERKIKLEYDNKWYDFIIKNIVENSSTYLYTYQLEDAIVTELSKNGFGTILDAKLQNNMNNAAGLAQTVLSETDWTVESEKIIEKVEENLVYATITKSDLPEGVKIYKLLDNDESITAKYPLEENACLFTKGVYEDEIEVEDFFDHDANREILVFYSSCKNKPYRFQFIYLNSYDKEDIKIHKNNRTIQEDDCQYFIEFWPNQYKPEDVNGFIMPEGITTLVKTYQSPSVSLPKGSDGTISVWYKGNRYGYAQKAVYSNILNRYINEYKKVGRPNTEKYYGFIDNEYVSPILQTNLVTNTQFRSTNGWTGTYIDTGNSTSQATVSNVYGRFDGKFISSLEDLSNGITNKTDEYKPYMKLSFVDGDSLVLNDGPYDNKAIIGNMEIGTQWALHVKYLNNSGGSGSGLSFAIKEYEYDSAGGYTEISSSPLSCNYSSTKSVTIGTGPDAITKKYDIYIVISQFASNKTFKDLSNVKIAITSNSGAEYYIEEIEFFQAKFNGETLITLDTQIDNTKVVIPTYYYFSEEKLDSATSIEDLEFDKKSDIIDTDYLPVFNEGAEKIRSVTAKESNYFNILQSIAETFECWVEFDINRDAFGISEKKVTLKNYIGKNNYACFRYGVNLKDIQRTYESKNITTKLIVKQNNNELGEDGFCTIQRAGANPTGESYIYDFQYYQNIGLMSADQYIDILYKMSNNGVRAYGPDITDSIVTDNSECNIQGYFPRLRELNRKIIAENKLLSGTTLELREIKIQLSVSEALYSAAKEGAEEVAQDFKKLTGFEPDEIGQPITACTISGEWATDKEAARTGHKLYSSYDNKFDIKNWNYSNKKLTITLTVKDGESFTKDTTIFVYAYPELTLGGTNITIERVGKNTVSVGDLSTTIEIPIELVDLQNSAVQEYLIQYSIHQQTEKDEYEKLGNYTEKSSDGTIIKNGSGLRGQTEELENTVNTYVSNINRWTKQKALLNRKFYKKYSRFIQEGTWISEEYVDDDKYYADALSVMYNSCYPQVAYVINAPTLSCLPEYELFNFELGDKTYVIDPEFFGDEEKEEVIITEMSNMLDEPGKDTIKIQNFKNQFQDLFQKIVATSQQVQYNAGSYEQGAAQAEAIAENSIEFLTQTLDEMTVNLSDPDLESTSIDGASAIKIVDGKILFGKKNNGKNEWTVGMSSKGISANKITAGQIDTGIIQIMSGTEPAFRWDAYGISAFGSTKSDGAGITNNQFVRFDKYGLYGIDGVDGLSWHATGNGYDLDPLKEINALATFALTWEGLKVTGNDGVVARIGKVNNNIIEVAKPGEQPVFSIDTDGNVKITAEIEATGGKIAGWDVSKNGLSSADGWIISATGDVELRSNPLSITRSVNSDWYEHDFNYEPTSSDDNGTYYNFTLTLYVLYSSANDMYQAISKRLLEWGYSVNDTHYTIDRYAGWEYSLYGNNPCYKLECKGEVYTFNAPTLDMNTTANFYYFNMEMFKNGLQYLNQVHTNSLTVGRHAGWNGIFTINPDSEASDGTYGVITIGYTTDSNGNNYTVKNFPLKKLYDLLST